MRGRIWFSGNPWPDGHAVTAFEWDGRLDHDGALWFDLHLETADYTAESDPPDDGGPGSWTSPVVWGNYHRCTMSSTHWDDERGVLAGTPADPFRLAPGVPRVLTADPLPVDDPEDSPAFHVYLLGHDAVAGHEISFTADGAGAHRVDWSGRVALTYGGDDEFRYSFRAEVRDAVLSRVVYPPDLAPGVAAGMLRRVLDVGDRFAPTGPGVLDMVSGHA